MKYFWILTTAFVFSHFAISSAQEAVRFRDATETAGLRQPLAGLLGHGAAVADYDGDGAVDLMVGGFCDRPAAEYAPADRPVLNHLFSGRGDGTFAMVLDVPMAAARTSGAVFADLNNAGPLELLVANNTRAGSRRDSEPQRSAQLQRSQLLRYASGKWLDVSGTSGAFPERLLSARNIGVLDYNLDGLLDLLLVEDRFRPGTSSTRLMKNIGDMQFEDVTEASGLPADVFGLGLAVADLNGDRYPDFFVPHSNRMFLSRGDLTYEEPAALRETFSWQPLDGEDWPCGAAFADLNRDGRLDLVLSIHSVTARNRVFLNTTVGGKVSFRDVTREVGLEKSVPVRCPHVEVQDFNNDGLPDIYLSAAWQDTSGSITPLIYVHQGVVDGLPKFEAPRAFDDSMVYFPAGPSADFDDDGRLDLFLVNWFARNHSRLLINQTAGGHWLKVRVVGSTSNRMGIGSRVEIFPAGSLGEQKFLVGAAEVTTGYGYASGQVAECHFGLGELASVDVRVTLSNGKQSIRQGVRCDQRLTVNENE